MKIIILRSGIFWKKWKFKIVNKDYEVITTSIGYNNYVDMFLNIAAIQIHIRGCEIINKFIN